jgi:hypothetical protein
MRLQACVERINMAIAASKFGVKVTTNVPYGSGRVNVSTSPKERALCLDVYEPEARSSGARPALIMAFGGAFHRGSKETDVGGFSAGARTSLNAVYGERPPAAATVGTPLGTTA